MLQSLYLNNFAIIDELTVDFNDGFTVITGETGAGKSILAGSLSFICGNKTDISILKNKEKKATVEAVFTDKSDSVNDFLKKQEIEPSTEIILRRELLPSGASRCYINETNVTVTILKEISFYLIDIHSQHQNLLLTRQNFQLFVLDSIANQHTDLIIYHEKYLKFKQFQSKLSVLKDEQQKSQQQLDFLTFQLNELNALTYSVQDFYDAEQESQTLEHAENISLKLNEIIYASHESEHAILIQFKNIIKTLQSLNNQYHKSSDWAQRIESIYFDFKDLVSEIENELHRIQSNPARLEQLQNELSSIYSLLQKHRLRNYDELLSLKEELQTKLSQISNIDEEVAKYEKEIKLLESELETLAHILHTKRQAVSDKLVKNILPLLEKLGMPQAKFIIELNYTEHLMESGKTNVDFLFSANTKIPPQPIEKIASGGKFQGLCFR
jgi:DNA repair protein RecN (Recombination protein N)